MNKHWPETARFALYAAPPASSALAGFGARWLGRDAETGADLPPPALSHLATERWRAITADARHYAFHGTLKAPFALADGMDYAGLTAALSDFTRTQAAFALPLALARIAGFLALVPAGEVPPLQALADACVARFEPFRRPETAEQVDKRRRGLTARQSALLDRWGYPYVFDEFRYHMTLTGRLDEAETAPVMDELAPLLQDALAEPLRIDALCLFAQADRAAPFRLIRRFPLAEA